MYRFALRPLWLLSHLLVIAGIIGMLFAGSWQLQRLDERRELNATVEARVVQALDPFTTAVDDVAFGAGDEIEYRSVRIEGVYRPADEVLVANRSLQGSPGFWVLTPLETTDGHVVAVNRGWVPFGIGDDGLDAVAAPPSGPVAVEGIVRTSQTAAGLQVADDDVGTLDVLNRPDLGRLQQQLDYVILPMYVDLQVQIPAQADGIPVPLEPPDLGEGPHLGYAVQWFIFAVIGIIGYPLVLRHVARRKQREALAPPLPDHPVNGSEPLDVPPLVDDGRGR